MFREAARSVEFTTGGPTGNDSPAMAAHEFPRHGARLVWKVRVDYCGADGMAKPMLWAVAAEPGRREGDYERRVREIFREKFPEWRMRSCAAAEEDVECSPDSLADVGADGAWLVRAKDAAGS